MQPVTRHTLDNGLVVLLKEAHSAPIISWRILYRVGSRNERTGQTGISHWVEHMLFKGTEQFPAGYLDKAIDREGGSWNAGTSMDYTTYYETLPANRIDLALRAEADRMVNALFDPAEVESERTVIISERQGSENSPLFWLREELQAAAFRVHGYHHEIIGDMADLHTMTRDDLYQHYRQHYTPNNAIIAAAGDFDSNHMLAQIESLYGSIPAVETPGLFVRPEPEQNGERRVQVHRPGKTAFVQIAYRTPAASDPDWFRLTLLDSVLSGPGGPGGGSISNKSSRLYRALVKTELAAGAYGGLSPTVDPFLYTFTLTARDGRIPAEIETAFDAEIQRVRETGISEAEFERAKKQARASFAYSAERVTNQTSWLARAEHFDSYAWFEHYLECVEAVDLTEVNEAARRYLMPQRRIVGWLIPEGDNA